MSYVTGSHAFKVGFTTQEAWHHAWYDDNGPGAGIGPGLVAYTFLNGLPSSGDRSMRSRSPSASGLKVNLGLYAQDQWTMKQIDAQPRSPLRLLQRVRAGAGPRRRPLRAGAHYDEVPCVPCWKDINPRLAASYDLFGNGKTAIKVNVGRFVAADIYTDGARQQPGHARDLERLPDVDRHQRQLQRPTAISRIRRRRTSAPSAGDMCGALNNNATSA